MIISVFHSNVQRHKFKKFENNEKKFSNLFLEKKKQKTQFEMSTITIFIFFGLFKKQKQTPKYIFPPIFDASVRFFKNESKL